MLAPGSQLGRYEIQRKLGRGGMGTVYVAHDPVLGRMVAIKVFQNDLDLPDAAERFTREARSAAALNHANIVTIYDFGDYDSRPYIAMEYVQGETLAAIIKRRASILLTEKLRWLEELCAGVSYAHTVSVVHRDLKPTNLMIDRTGRLKVLDFGIAKIMGALATTATGPVGTPGYMAPEQISGGATDHRADIFAIGVVAYELLSYSDAFPGENTHAISHKVMTQQVAPLAPLIPDAPSDLVGAVDRALRKLPAERFSEADEFRMVIARIRRQIESDTEPAGAPTIVMGSRGRDGDKPATGGAKADPGDPGAAAPTPPPTLRQTDPDSLARRRATQIDAALERSRAALHRGELEVASDECLQALTLDEKHAGALELEAVIKTAIVSRRTAWLLDEARQELMKGGLTGAHRLLSQARELDPAAPDLRTLERDLLLARVEQERARHRSEQARVAKEHAEEALARGDIESALTFARESLDLEPGDTRARALEVQALKALDDLSASGFVRTVTASNLATLPDAHAVAEPAPTIVASAPTIVAPPPIGAAPGTTAPSAPAPSTAPPSVPAPPVPQRSAAKAFALDRYVAAVRKPLDGAVSAWRGIPARQRAIVAGLGVGAFVLALVGVGVALRPAAPPTTFTVVIDAVPFATVTRIERADGTPLETPQFASTPLSITLPAGSYHVSLAGPAPEDQSRTVTLDVHGDGTAAIPIERFRTLTPTEYFEQYLSSPVETPAADDDVTEGAPAVAPVSVAGTPAPAAQGESP